jgi:POT family proton-dependent oligopeptide transporter
VPAGGRAFVKETLSAEGIKALLRLGGIILFVAMFWSLFDQTASSWVEQGEKMNREVFGFTIMSAQMQGWNPILIIILVPVFAYVVYPFINKFFPLTPLRKISIGFFVTVIAFLIPAWIEYRIGLGEQPSIAWQALAYLVLTSAEVMVSITGLEFFYTQSPRKMKSLVMSFWLLSVAIGNGFTALVNKLILMGGGGSALSGAGYYLFFSGGMLLTALLFIPYAKGFEERRYTQDEA